MVENVTLSKFAQRDIQRIVRDCIPVSPALAELIARRSDGNPASASELIRHVAESDKFGAATPASPDALFGDFADAAASARRQRIRDAAKGDPDVLAVWERAAVLGLRFETELLRAMLVQTELDDVDATMEWALTLGVTEGIVTEEVPGTFGFDNSLLRDALINRAIETGTHAQLHLAAAKVLGRLHEANVDEVAYEIAGHIELGGRPVEATPWYVRAAHAAERAHRTHMAVEAWQAAELLANAQANAEVRIEALLHLGACHLQLATLEECENCAMAARRAAAVADIAEPNESTRLLAEVARRSGQNRLARERYRAAMAGFEQVADKLGLARTHYSIGELELADGRLDEAERHLRGALALYEALGDRDGEAHAYWALGRTALGTGLYDEAAGYTAKSRYRHESAQNRRGAALCLMTLGEIAELTANEGEALAHFEKAQSELSIIGDRHAAAEALMHIGFVSDANGNTARAETSLRESIRAFEAMGDRHAALLARLALARLLADQGAWDDADTELVQVFEGDAEERIDDSRFVRLLVAIARLALFGGRTDLARRLLETASFKLSRIAHASPLYDAVDEVQYLLHELGDDTEGSGEGVVDFDA
jgi:tetratricopeptide (TPR) repeat protein